MCVCLFIWLYSFIYESGDGLEEDEIERYNALSKKPLADVGIENGTTVEISDFSQKLDLSIVVVDKQSAETDKVSEDDAFEVISGDTNQLRKDNAPEEASTTSVEDKEKDSKFDEDEEGSDDDDLVIL